mmetsp:Transcript_104397/g.225253  ORF Transcript_104397/g.225253 Transcript_104397/m.225253 type:complete len:355 (-) Transcript_104397:202-1266(-)
MSAEALLRPAIVIPEDSSPSSVSRGDGESSNRSAGNIIKVSLGVALTWWGFGVYTVISTASLAVLASLVDATIDLAAQGVLLGANTLAESNGTEKSYPAGVSRLEPVGVIVCSVLMALASGAVIYDSVETFAAGRPDMHFTNTASVLLSVVVCVKIAVWRIAKREYDRTNNVSLEALALDNFNDILSNASALVFASMTRINGDLWWMDPIGGVLISVYIIRSWCLTAFEQINMLVGKEAHPEFLSTVREIAEAHHPDAAVDVVRAYHFGPKFLVEVELVMDPKTPLEISHDVGMLLQDQIEHMDECERCFVHIDYAHRGDIDHDKYVPIHSKTSTPPADLRGNARSLQTVAAAV